MYDAILVPLDGSTFAETVLPLVELVAKAGSSKVTFVMVGEPYIEEVPYGPEGIGIDQAYDALGLPPTPSSHQHRIFLDQVIERFRAYSNRYLEGAAQPLRAQGITIDVEVLLGRVADQVTRCAQDKKADLIAMATHGRTGLARLRYGSVANELTQRLQAPLLLMRPKDAASTGGDKDQARIPRGVVVPLDGSSLAEQALPHAKAICSTLGVGVHLIRAVTQSVFPFLGPEDEVAMHDLQADRVKAAGEYLGRVRDDLAAGGLAVQTAVLHGQPAANIVTYATGLGESLICMTSHGRTGLGRVLLGSVADKVLQEMPDSVYLVRGRA